MITGIQIYVLKENKDNFREKKYHVADIRSLLREWSIDYVLDSVDAFNPIHCPSIDRVVSGVKWVIRGKMGYPLLL